jgi:hypothetical protein
VTVFVSIVAGVIALSGVAMLAIALSDRAYVLYRATGRAVAGWRPVARWRAWRVARRNWQRTREEMQLRWDWDRPQRRRRP